MSSSVRSSIYSILIFLALGILSSCSSFDLIPSDSLIQRLKDRGPVLVSIDNPYLAANLLLKQESKHSAALSGFLDTKGLPAAISVSQDFFEPARLKLFYRTEDEQYDLELLQGLWVIKGPSTIHDQAAKDLLASLDSLDSKDVISKSRKPKSSTARTKTIPTKTEIAEKGNTQFVPLFDQKSANNDFDSSVEAAKIKPEESKPVEIVKENTTTVQSEVVAPLKTTNNIEDLISRFTSSPAETTPRGDIVHYVTSEQETMEIIAKWYTKTPLTLSRIARANKLATSAILSPGDQIVIPSELVKNKMRLPEEAIPSLTQ